MGWSPWSLEVFRVYLGDLILQMVPTPACAVLSPSEGNKRYTIAYEHCPKSGPSRGFWAGVSDRRTRGSGPGPRGSPTETLHETPIATCSRPTSSVHFFRITRRTQSPIKNQRPLPPHYSYVSLFDVHTGGSSFISDPSQFQHIL